MKTHESTDVAGAKSLTPGSEQDGVGHPSTRDQPGNTREPGTYSGLKIASTDHKTSPSEGITSVAPGSEVASDAHPAAKDFPHDTSKVSHEKPAVATGAPPATPPKDKVAASPASPSASNHTSALSPTSTTNSKTTSGHRRTSSNSSGKKVGFMDKVGHPSGLR